MFDQHRVKVMQGGHVMRTLPGSASERARAWASRSASSFSSCSWMRAHSRACAYSTHRRPSLSDV